MNISIKNTIKTTLFTAAFATASVSAHDLSMWPSQFNIHSEKPTIVTVDLSFSESPYRLDHAASAAGFSVLDPKGKKLRRTGNLYQSAQRTTIDLPVTEQGTYTLLYQNTPRYTTSYTLENKEAKTKSKKHRLRLDKAAAQSQLPKSAKNIVTKKSTTTALSFITNTLPSEASFKATGVDLEITPNTHPSDYVTNDTISIKVTYNGKPLKNTSVYLKRDGAQYTADSTPQKLSTNNQGELAFLLKLGGRYILSIQHSVKEATTLYDEVGHRLFYAFEVNYE